MKNTLSLSLFASTLLLSATTGSAQSLGAAAFYDVFALNGGYVELKDANQLFGNVGISNGAELDGKGESNTWNGTIFKHTGGTIKDGGGLNPSGGIQTSAVIDAALNQGNTDLVNYVNALNGFGSTGNFGNVSSAFSYSSIGALNVLDFKKLDLEGVNFTLTGGATDKFIIRVSDAFEFKEADLILNGVSRNNLVWLYNGNDKFDLHKSDSDPANFMKFEGTIIAPDGSVRLGEVNFKGKVMGAELKLGSGFVFEPPTPPGPPTPPVIPEPSSSLMFVMSAASLLLVRRRKN